MSSACVSVMPKSSEEILVPEDMSSSSAETSLLHIFDELWSKVFAHLQLEDRNRVRLTCHRFYHLCNDLSNQKDEKIVFNGICDLDVLIQTWSCTERELRSLRLNGSHLMDDSILELFKNQGPYIRSLTLHKCKIEPGLLKQMLEYCQSLRSISLIRISTQQNLFDDFQALERNGIVCPDVTSLTYVLKEAGSHSFHLSNCQFLRLFAVFPNVRKLKLKIRVDAFFSLFSTLSADIRSDSMFTFSSIHDQLSKIRHQLEELSLSFVYGVQESYLTLQTLNHMFEIEMCNLKKLSLNWIDLCDQSIRNPFLPIRHLTHFDCIIGLQTLVAYTPSDFLQLLLSTATELDTLLVGFTDAFDDLYLEKDCFVALVRSRLQILDMYAIPIGNSWCKAFRAVRIAFELSAEDSLLPNRALKCLKCRLDNRALALFATYFQSLDYLVADEMDQSVLQNVLKYQRQLRSLYLNNCHMHPNEDYIFKDCRYLQTWLLKENPNRRFDQLTHLDVLENEELDLSEFLLAEFEFPKLKSLSMKSIGALGTTELDLFQPNWALIRKFKKLQLLEVDSNYEIRFAKVSVLCSVLPKLRYLVISNRCSKPFEDHEYRGLFQIRPSLITFIHRCQDMVKYTKDVRTNTVTNIPSVDQGHLYQGIPKKHRPDNYL